MEVGGSSKTEQVPTVTKAVTLDISIDDYDESSVKAALAAEYGVDPALITLSAAAGSLEITITIATSGTAADGTVITAPLADLVTAVESVTVGDMATALSTELNTAVTVVGEGSVSQGSLNRVVTFECPKGKWCTAGLVVDCTEGTYNPLVGQDLGTACIKCPEFSTSPASSTSINDCTCNDGFVQTVLADGSAKCECAPGKEIINGMRCDPCQYGSYKTELANSKCTECGSDVYSSEHPLGAMQFLTTAQLGSTKPEECVCRVGYYHVADPVTGQDECKLCTDTHYQMRPGTNCTEPGTRLDVLPVMPGFFRQGPKAQMVRKCINIDADAACLGGVRTNESDKCAEGHGGPYCAVCDSGYHGGGNGKPCVPCEGDTGKTIVIQVSGAFGVLLVLVLLLLRFGRKAVETAAAVAENDGDYQGMAEEEAQAKLEAVAEEGPPKKKLVARAIGFAQGFGVKFKILISLYQVLNGLGMVFTIPYPNIYEDIMSQIGVINIDFGSLMPLKCLFPLNFLHKLLIQTIGPLAIIFGLETFARSARKANAEKAARAAAEGGGEKPMSLFLAEIASNMSFFLLFLFYPGSSSKIFQALFCQYFNAEGEDGQGFLRVDFGIDCASPLYVGFMFPYAIVMLFVYPVGVPFYYATLLFRNRAELRTLRHLELSIASEASRAELGSFLTGKPRDQYQPEIDEAEARKAELEEKYAERRGALPGALKKLTNGCASAALDPPTSAIYQPCLPPCFSRHSC